MTSEIEPVNKVKWYLRPAKKVLAWWWPEIKDAKMKWGEGLWRVEPDKVVWKDEETGLPCLIRRNAHSGILCGYVGVAPGHPCYEESYWDIDVEVHGGLTFAAPCDVEEDMEHAICHVPEAGDPDNVWWFGFDCGHYMDVSPGYNNEFMSAFRGKQTYKNVGYVKEECERLARQLKGLEAKT